MASHIKKSLLKVCKKKLIHPLNDYLLVNLDSINFLASMMHVAQSNSHELHQMDGKDSLKQNFKFEAKVNWG